MFNRKRRVRLHLMPGLGPETVEGIMRGRRPVAGHYVLALPAVVLSEHDTHSLPNSIFEVPARNVVLVEVTSG